MTQRTRLSKLEQTRPASGAVPLDLDLPPDLCARIAAAMEAGTYPHGLCGNDLEAIMTAADMVGGCT